MKKKIIQTCQKTQKELSSSFQSLNLVPVEMAMILEPRYGDHHHLPCGIGLKLQLPLGIVIGSI